MCVMSIDVDHGNQATLEIIESNDTWKYIVFIYAKCLYIIISLKRFYPVISLVLVVLPLKNMYSHFDF